MSNPIIIDTDALFRAVTATGYKLLAYNLNLDTGEVISRTMRPDEVSAPPPGPSVRPLPKMGGDLTVKKEFSPFGPAPVEKPKPKLFNDEDGPKKPAFENDFFKRDEKKKPDLFGDGGFKKESGAKKLAEIFSKPESTKLDPFAKPAEAPSSEKKDAVAPPPEDPRCPRIPAVSDEQQLEWMTAFAKEFGDPEIRDEMGRALSSAKPAAAWEKLLRKHIRAGQQWERYFRRNAIFFAETWLSDLGISWELSDATDLQ
jgi:hypothetical protein